MARLEKERKELEDEETATASEGEGCFEVESENRVSKANQTEFELECSHRMSIAVLRSKCTTNTKEKKLFSHFTGFRSYSQFKEFLEFILPNLDRNTLVYWGTVQAKNNRIDTNLLFDTHTTAESTSSDSEASDTNSSSSSDSEEYQATSPDRKYKLDVEDEFLLLLMRINLGLSVTDLSFRFNIAESTVSSMVTTWLNFLYTRLGNIKTWPHRNILVQNMPSEFKKKYPNNVAIIDCTEIKIQRPSSFIRQSQSYSSYKSTNTFKSLVGVDAKGGFIFVSQLYTGSISDKQIVIRSGFLSLLEQKLSVGEILPQDSIMADKGFDIENELGKLQLALNAPPFLGSDLQFEEEDVVKTQTVAQHWIHVERAIGKVRRFHIFSAPLPVTMLGCVNQLWTVCCFMSNFMDPILD